MVMTIVIVYKASFQNKKKNTVVSSLRLGQFFDCRNGCMNKHEERQSIVLFLEASTSLFLQSLKYIPDEILMS